MQSVIESPVDLKMSAIAQGKRPQHRVGRYGRTCFLSSFCKLESRSGANVRSDWRSQSGTISWGPLGLLVVETLRQTCCNRRTECAIFSRSAFSE